MGGRSQDWVTEGHWSRLLGGFGLQAGWENMGKHEKGSSKQEGEPSPSWLCLWDLRVLQNPETFTSGLPALLIFTTRGHKRHSSRKTSHVLNVAAAPQNHLESFKKHPSNPGLNPRPTKAEYRGLAQFNMVDTDHMWLLKFKLIKIKQNYKFSSSVIRAAFGDLWVSALQQGLDSGFFFFFKAPQLIST